MNATKRNPAPFAVIGIVTAFLFALVILVAAENDPSWVLGESMISDLGVSDVELTADLFKYGCMLAGILTFVFGVGKAYTENGCSRASGIIIAIAGIFLLLLGYYNSDFGNGNMHETFAWLFFIFLAVAAILSAFGDWAENKKVNSMIACILILVVVGAAVGKPEAYVEFVAVAAGVLWMLSESAKMILNIREADIAKKTGLTV